MSFLAPLYVLGALAIVGPIVFHLIRRTPKGEVPFSSLMFLAPTPPKLTRRSRLDNLLLLLLRVSALALLAFAFARPFVREPSLLNFGDVERRRVAILIDTSASMRRGDLWARAKALANEAIAEARPDDQVAILAFDATTRPILTFAESATLDPAKRLAVAKARVDALEPTWAGTDLGRGLVDAVAAIEDVADKSEKAGRMPRRVVLIGDLQQGAKLDALGNFAWPSDVDLALKTVADPAPNAGLQLVADSPDATPAEVDKERRVRVANDPGSKREGFKIAWVDDRGNELSRPVDAYVPPGESRVVKVPKVPGGSTLKLQGDAHGFDNTLYFAAEKKEDVTVLFLGGDDPGDAEGMLYYLGRVFEDSPRKAVKVVARRPGEPVALELARSTPLVVVASEVNAEVANQLRKYAEAGGTVLFVATKPGPSPTLGTLVESDKAIEFGESPAKRDAMLAEIAFDHPLFAPLAGAQFNDFTKIRFWKHRTLDEKALGAARVLARFEGGDPAFVEKPIGRGRLVVMAGGWAPVDGQLARTSKFVPLMAAMLEGRNPPPATLASYTVLDPVPMSGSEKATVLKPDGSKVEVEPGRPFEGADLPGIYKVEAPSGSRSFAVNLDPAESKAVPLAVETLEQLGCKLAASAERAAAERDHLRQLQNAELEGRQKLWRALILATIGVLIVETWLAGRHSRTRPTPTEVLAT